MKNRILLSISFLLTALSFSYSVQAQTLQSIDMSLPGGPLNTYLTDINNRGCVTGYYNFAGTNKGFVITANGKRILIDIAGYSDTKGQSINDNNVVLVNASNGAGNITPYRVYIDTLGDTITGVVQVTTMQQPSGIPCKININNDISGYYQGASEKWIFSDRDSLGGWYANRYYDGTFPNYTYYNCYAGGVTNNNIVAGHYIDGITYHPFLYDATAQTWTLLTGALNKTKIWDINNNNMVVGEYLQANGYYMGFWATLSGAAMTTHSLNTYFQDPTIQSVVNGINDNGEMVGAFLHPSGYWQGFIFRPNQQEFRIPNFNFEHNTWKMVNNNAVPATVWPNTFWSGFSYGTQDIYANNGSPLLDQYVMQTYNVTAIYDSVTPDWKSFCEEIDSNQYGLSANPLTQAYYNNILKHIFVAKWAPLTNYIMNGYCYGFSHSALMRHFFDTTFSNWYGLPLGTDISTVTNTNTNAIRSIVRSFSKQSDAATFEKWGFYNNYNKESVGAGLFRLKNTYNRPFEASNPSSIAIEIPQGLHNILPYKIHTPQKLPFDGPIYAYDTVFIYDSNEPGDSSKYFLVKANEWFAPHDSAWSSNYDIQIINFNKPGIRDINTRRYTAFKGTSNPGDLEHLSFSLGHKLYYNINSTNTQASLNGTGFSINNTTDYSPQRLEAIGPAAPASFFLDTSTSVNFVSNNYADSSMLWNQNNSYRTMGITRKALPTETDNGSLKYKQVSYDNHDPVVKSLTCYLTQVSADLSQGVSLMANGICAAQGDSIVTENSAPYTYTITKVNGTTTCTYDLTIFSAYNDTVKEFVATGITFPPNTRHTIDPYFVGPNGPTVAVLVDEGLDGSINDTLFVPQVGLGIDNPVHYAPYVKVYPNPAANYLNVDIMASQVGTLHASLCDITGRIIYKKDMPGNTAKLQVPLSSYKPGTYLFMITDDKGQILYRDKVVKE